jgi:hypothetical protein
MGYNKIRARRRPRVLTRPQSRARGLDPGLRARGSSCRCTAHPPRTRPTAPASPRPTQRLQGKHLFLAQQLANTVQNARSSSRFEFPEADGDGSTTGSYRRWTVTRDEVPLSPTARVSWPKEYGYRLTRINVSALATRCAAANDCLKGVTMSNNRLAALIGAVGVVAASGSAAGVIDSPDQPAAGRTATGLGANSTLVTGSSPVLTAVAAPIGGGGEPALSPLVVLGLLPGGVGGTPGEQPIAVGSSGALGGPHFTAADSPRFGGGGGTLRVVGLNGLSPNLIRFAAPGHGGGSGGGPTVSAMPARTDKAAAGLCTMTTH